MVTIRYDAGEAEPAEIEPMDNTFRYVADGDYVTIKVGETENEDVVKWIPNERIYEIQGLRSRIRSKLL